MVDLLLQFATKSGKFQKKIQIFVGKNGFQFQTPKDCSKIFFGPFKIICLKTFDLLSLATKP